MPTREELIAIRDKKPDKPAEGSFLSRFRQVVQDLNPFPTFEERKGVKEKKGTILGMDLELTKTPEGQQELRRRISAMTGKTITGVESREGKAFTDVTRSPLYRGEAFLQGGGPQRVVQSLRFQGLQNALNEGPPPGVPGFQSALAQVSPFSVETNAMNFMGTRPDLDLLQRRSELGLGGGNIARPMDPRFLDRR